MRGVWRFDVRKTDDGHGVWDSTVNGWRSKLDLTEDQAHEQAMDMDIQYDTYGPRNPTSIRRPDTAVPVKVAQWHTGSTLDAWIDERGQWWGRVRDPSGRLTWHPATDLQPDNAP